MLQIHYAGYTHIGRRKSNQDAYCTVAPLGLFAVADGMGGYQGGEIASQLTIQTITDFMRRNYKDDNTTWPYKLDRRLSLAENMVDVSVRMANSAVCEQRKGPLEKMGTTLAMLHFPKSSTAPNRVVIAHMGDSRVYRLRAGRLTLLTRDHSLYEQLKATGASLPPVEQFTHANVITKALGVEPKGRPDLLVEQLVGGDRYLLCSDGLNGPLRDHEIQALLKEPAREEACQGVVQAAYDAGGKDNITAVLVDIQQ